MSSWDRDGLRGRPRGDGVSGMDGTSSRVLQRASQRLIAVVGASGAGKDSVLRAWLSALPAHARPALAQRTITRPAGDPSERHETIEEAAFHAAHASGAFAFTWQAHGLHYGVRWPQLDPLSRGGWVVMNASRAHLPVLRAAAPRVRVIEVVASAAARRERLTVRQREDAGAAHARLVREVPEARAELVVANDGELAAAVASLQRWWCHAVASPFA